ncbi:MAG: hypothetical protein K5697_08940 [Lachnospiraceae bacterium]|nr:hypothetical protein [Lachnospiraceae bacterium]
MFHTITLAEFVSSLSEEHPTWNREAIIQEAQNDLENWDERLEPAVIAYIREGRRTDFRLGDFSILMIQALHYNCGFLTAAGLMDAYLKDPKNGKALILRRSTR